MSAPNSSRLTVIDYEAVKAVTRDEKTHARRLVERMARDDDDRQLLEDVLFEEARVKPPRGFRGREPRDEPGLRPCGTEAACQRHKARGEECEPCRLAANEARAASGRRVRARRKAETAAKGAA